MKKKHLIMIIALITVGTLTSVLAQSNFTKLPGSGWFTNHVQAMTNMNGLAPATKLIIHDKHYPTSGTFNNTLNKAQVSQHQDGDTVVVISADGELPGVLTLKLHRDTAGTAVIGGEWAFNVSYTEERHVEPGEPGGGDHRDFLVQRGTVKGTIASGQVTPSGDGSVSAINSVQLAVDSGSLDFHAANSGNGSGQIINLQDWDATTGNLTLSF